MSRRRLAGRVFILMVLSAAPIVCLVIFGPIYFAILIAFYAVIILSTNLLILERIKENKDIVEYSITERVRKLCMIEFHQIESLLSLHRILDFQAALPSFREWSVSPDFALILAQTVFDHMPKMILECGSGTSSVVIGLALKKVGGGKLIALEHDRQHAERTKRLLDSHDLDEYATVVWTKMTDYSIGDRNWVWYDLTELKIETSIDVIVVDGPPESYGSHARYPVLPIIQRLLKDETIVLVDDGSRPQEEETISMWQHEKFVRQSEFLETEKGAYRLVVQKFCEISEAGK